MFKKIGYFALTLGAAIPFVGPQIAKAAPDSDLSGVLATGTTLINDNTGTVLTFLGSAWGKGLLIGVTLTALSLAGMMIRGAILKRRRK